MPVDPTLQAILDAYATEPFWGVRLEMAQALETANSAAAAERICSRCPS